MQYELKHGGCRVKRSNFAALLLIMLFSSVPWAPTTCRTNSFATGRRSEGTTYRPDSFGTPRDNKGNSWRPDSFGTTRGSDATTYRTDSFGTPRIIKVT